MSYRKIKTIRLPLNSECYTEKSSGAKAKIKTIPMKKWDEKCNQKYGEHRSAEDTIFDKTKKSMKRDFPLMDNEWNRVLAAVIEGEREREWWSCLAFCLWKTVDRCTKWENDEKLFANGHHTAYRVENAITIITRSSSSSSSLSF